MLAFGLCVSPDYFVTKEQEQEESRILGVRITFQSNPANNFVPHLKWVISPKLLCFLLFSRLCSCGGEVWETPTGFLPKFFVSASPTDPLNRPPCWSQQYQVLDNLFLRSSMKSSWLNLNIEKMKQCQCKINLPLLIITMMPGKVTAETGQSSLGKQCT